MGEVGGLHYIHERIDRLVSQTAFEIGLLRNFVGMDEPIDGDSIEEQDDAMQLISDRFWTAQDIAADNHNQEQRDHGTD